RELEQLTDRELESDEQIVDAARQLIGDNPVEIVVVSLGAGGATMVTADQVKNVRAPTVPIRSRVGAGDSMVAALVVALARGRIVADAVRYAVAAGAAAVMTPGTELCRAGDVDAIYERMGEGADPDSGKT
ncbi:MAG: PfkB family carbohydrate kinase, partial [Phycisphaeraceae bacterium]|nr:PfkB family carbohydrate kinase [Phycisphaeraceae bacterium]